MKVNKLWSIMIMLVLVLGTAIAFSSCSNDEEETLGVNSETKKFVGTWKDEHGGWTWTYTLRSDGTCSSKYVAKREDYAVLNSDAEGKWSYGLNILTIIPDNGLNRHTWVVTQVSNNSITVVENGESTILVRVE